MYVSLSGVTHFSSHHCVHAVTAAHSRFGCQTRSKLPAASEPFFPKYAFWRET
ncbi:hypothetical protein ACOMHN_014906 [Nucella lapillus]